MEFIFSAIILVLVVIWASRIEIGINKMNDTLRRIEEQLNSKKERK